MLFNSISYLVFFPLVVFLYYSIGANRRWILLLTASYIFYMCWRVEYVLLIMISTLVDYIVALRMEKTDASEKRKCYLALSIFTNLGLLFIFKYYNFFGSSLNAILGITGAAGLMPEYKVLLPIGISFYTFQTLSYTIDVYKGRQKAERHLGIFAVYVSFFPQLVAGPIERSGNLIPQIHKFHEFRYRNVSDGLKLMMWGFFKKLVIADRAALMVNTIYNNPAEYEGFPLLLATYLFAFQIYCDFSAYSDIARGSARVMGINLMDNFSQPYLSHNIREFWQRWHISLSSWFRDYLYIPLGGNRVKSCRYYLNIGVVFFLSGLWHGANFTFLVWGLLHGVYYMITQFIGKLQIRKIDELKKKRLVRIIEILFTFHLVCFGWIFFRSRNLGEALYIVTHLFKNLKILWHDGWGLSSLNMLLLIISLIIMVLIQDILGKEKVREYLANRTFMFRNAVYAGFIFFILSMGILTDYEFIYFQF
jgi:alginate O-acetyltransferase complex protein AlgI